MERPVSRLDLANALLKQLEVSSSLYNLMFVDRTDYAAYSAASAAYFKAQNEMLSLAREIALDE